jgi:serine/threonine-protein kinase
MVMKRSQCNPSRLKGLIDDDLSATGRVEVVRHLDDCPACQARLEELAAGSRLWGDLRQLAGSGDPAGRGRGAHAEETGVWPKGRPDPAREILGLLAPAGDPDALGRLGPYEVTGVLGRGGMGVVLRGFDPSLNRPVAIKVLAPQLATSAAARKRFAREARAAASVVHDHVVAIYAVDVDEHSGLPYLVMPYLPGRSLQDRIDRDGPLDPKEVLRIGLQAAHGLAAAHSQGLVHRDVKPSNILLENNVERVKLTDFGLARAADDASLTHPGDVAGTPQYMSPEQARGDAVDHRADLFSLGSVLYAMCTGRPPFRADTVVGVLRRVCDERPRPVRELNPDVPAPLAAVIERLHAKHPAGRFRSAAEVADALGRLLAESQRPAPRGAVAARTRTRAVRLGAVAAVAAMVGVLASFGGISGKPRWTSWAARAGSPQPGGGRILSSGPGGSFLVASADEPKGGGHPDSPRGSITFADGPDDSVMASGKEETRRYDLKDFDAIEVDSVVHADVTRGDEFRVEVTLDDNLLEFVKVEKKDRTLKVGLDPRGKSLRLRNNHPPRLTVRMPALEAMRLHGATFAKVSGFKSDRRFRAELDGASHLEGSIEAGELELHVDGAGHVTLGGSAGDAKVSSSGAGQIRLGDFTLKGKRLIVKLDGASHATLKGRVTGAVVQSDGASHLDLSALELDVADVTVSGASHVNLGPSKQLDYSVTGVSHLTYAGDPKVDKAEKDNLSHVRHRTGTDSRK